MKEEIVCALLLHPQWATDKRHLLKTLFNETALCNTKLALFLAGIPYSKSEPGLRLSSSPHMQAPFQAVSQSLAQHSLLK